MTKDRYARGGLITDGEPTYAHLRVGEHITYRDGTIVLFDGVRIRPCNGCRYESDHRTAVMIQTWMVNPDRFKAAFQENSKQSEPRRD